MKYHLPGRDLFQLLPIIVEAAHFVDGTIYTAFGSGPSIGEHHNEGVVQFADILQGL